MYMYKVIWDVQVNEGLSCERDTVELGAYMSLMKCCTCSCSVFTVTQPINVVRLIAAQQEDSILNF